MNPRIAILGAGAAGVCTALELAARGHPVTLFDENDRPVTRASRINEGKIHLGLLYAKDGSHRTATTMITGALQFEASLRRWIDPGEELLALSTPFYYAVHRDTMVSVDALKGHYARCQQIFTELQEARGHAYLGLDRRIVVEELDRPAVEALVDGRQFVTAFRTSERSIDPRPLADALGEAVAAEPRIDFHGKARVLDVEVLGNGRLRVTWHADGDDHCETFDHVANTLWHGRLQIDAKAGVTYDRPWIYRYKFGSRVFVPLDAATPPSITCVLGPFGDIVNFGRRGMYVSWYPIGMTNTSRELVPPEWGETYSADDRYEVFRRSYEHWVGLCPALGDIAFSPEDVDPSAGVIFTWGETDIDDHDSELHERHEIGIFSAGNYHTVNTGKFTMAPYVGVKTAERILGVG